MKNSEILFIYEAVMCNPNGDPDEENKPRMDYVTERNLVSDVRLKRYIRDYWQAKGKEVFVSKVEGETVDATQKIAYACVQEVIRNPNDYSEELVNMAKERENEWKDMRENDLYKFLKEIDVRDLFIDIRTFGAVLPLKGAEGRKGASDSYTGPVQFNWGYSLNRAEIVESSSITSTFAGRTNRGDQQYGTIGKDWRIYYSLIAFWGVVSSRWAENTHMTEGDLKELEEAMIKAIPLWVTRTKVNQRPLLYMRIEYNDGETLMGDKRHLLKCSPDTDIRSVKDYKLDIEALVREIEENERINKVYYWCNEELTLSPEISSKNDKFSKLLLQEGE